MTGIVKWFSAERGFGFIKQTDGVDVFVHYSAIEARGFRCLDAGQIVAYEVLLSAENHPEATHVVKL